MFTVVLRKTYSPHPIMPLEDDPDTWMSENEIKFIKFFKAKYARRTTKILTVAGMDLLVDKMVVSPEIETKPHLTLDRLSKLVFNKTVLDVGTGCGINGIYAALNGAKYVTATDLDPAAVQNTKDNIERFQLQDRMCAFESNVFDNVQGKFDVIVANLPIAEVNQLNGSEPAWSIIARFLCGLKEHLMQPDGRALLFCVSFADPKVFKQIYESGSIVDQSCEENDLNVKMYVFELALPKQE